MDRTRKKAVLFLGSAAVFTMLLPTGCHRAAEPSRELAGKPSSPAAPEGSRPASQEGEESASGKVAARSGRPVSFEQRSEKPRSADSQGRGGPTTAEPIRGGSQKSDALLVALDENGGNLGAALSEISVKLKRNRYGEIERLYLTGPDITDRALKHIGTVNSLRVLDIWEAPITDEGLKHISGLTRLVALGLRQTDVTDDGLRHLAGMARLTELNLTGTAVTDAGMKHLAELRTVRRVGLDDTDVTGDGINELQNALPFCHIAW